MRRTVVSDAGIVDQDVDVSPPLQHLAQDSTDLCGLTEIAPLANRAHTKLLCLSDNTRQPGFVDIQQVKIGSFASERQRDAASNPRRGTCHQSLLVPDRLHRAQNSLSTRRHGSARF